MVFFSSQGTKEYWDVDYQDESFLIFGKESVGLPMSLTTTYSDRLYKIPIHSEHIRSINLANAVSAVVYEGLRQCSQRD